MAKMTYESRVEKAKAAISAKPYRVLQEIGKFLVQRVKANVRSSTKVRTYFRYGKKIKVSPGRLKKSIGYWARKREKDLQIGSKAFYASWVEKGSSNNRAEPFLTPTVEAEINTIQELVASVYKELEKE
jgi:HK97 gp10 family phage protein